MPACVCCTWGENFTQFLSVKAYKKFLKGLYYKTFLKIYDHLKSGNTSFEGFSPASGAELMTYINVPGKYVYNEDPEIAPMG